MIFDARCPSLLARVPSGHDPNVRPWCASLESRSSAIHPHSPDRFHPIADIQRPGRAGEVAAAILFLASDDASYVTGALLFVDGGMTAL
jgi:NAD(P)-dependent dehydrogenase (short-subunit alcohol dehydrogenase family)